MTEPTIIAFVMFGFVASIMLTAIHKEGVQGAIKIWQIMGVITGVGFGSITSHYFTNNLNKQEISRLQTQNETMKINYETKIAQINANHHLDIASYEKINIQEKYENVQMKSALEKATKNADKISSIIYPLSQGFKGKFTHATITGEITPTFDFNSIPQITRVKWATQLDDASEVAKTIKKIVAEIKTSNTIIDKQPE